MYRVMAFRLFVRFKEPSPRFIRGRIRISKARPPNSVRATIAPASQPAVALTFQMREHTKHSIKED